MPDHVAVKIIRENAGTQFDPKIVNIFLKLHDRGEIKANLGALPQFAYGP